MRRAIVPVLLAAGIAAAPAGAQQPVPDSRLVARLDGKLRDVVVEIVDSARRDGLPTDPLIEYALQGVSARATSSRVTETQIIAAVSRFAHDLRRARQALGPAATPADVQAGAVALRSGVDVKHLERLRAAREGQRVATGLNVLNYIVGRNVPADTAASVIVNLVLVSATDDQLFALEDAVERDIAGGTPPATAMSARGQGLTTMIAAAQTNNGGAPGGALPSGLGSTRPAGPAANGALGGGAGTGSVSGGGSKPAPAGHPKKP